MQFFKYFAISVVILALVIPADAGWRRAFRKVGRALKKTVKAVGKAVSNVGKAVKKVGCKALFGVACPVAVGAAGAALGAGTSGAGSAIVAVGVIAGNNACHVRSKKCKRSVKMTEIMLPFSDEISDYDMNGDKLVTYEEFVWAVLRSVNLADPDELLKPFAFADFDGDGVLDTDEFYGAPFLFAHANRKYMSASAA